MTDKIIEEKTEDESITESSKQKTQAQEDAEYLSVVANTPGARWVARIALVFLAILFIATIILGIMGSDKFMGMLALCIICPIGMYVFLWLGKLLRKLNK